PRRPTGCAYGWGCRASSSGWRTPGAPPTSAPGTPGPTAAGPPTTPAAPRRRARTPTGPACGVGANRMAPSGPRGLRLLARCRLRGLRRSTCRCFAVRHRAARRGRAPARRKRGRAAVGSHGQDVGLFDLDAVVDRVDELVGDLLDLALAAAEVVLADVAFVLHHLQFVVAVAADVAHRHLGFLRHVVHRLDEVAAA